MRSISGLTARALALLLLAGAAYAQALVTVKLKGADGAPAAGKVTLQDAQGKVVASCVAQAGQCEMSAVPGGTYTVTVEPQQGTPPKPRKVMIPPSGKVSLVVAAS